MSKTAMKLALYALEVEDMACRYEKDPTPEHIAKAITALREALAEQKSGIKQVIELYDSPDQPTQRQARSADTWVNATTWRGLTDEDIDQCLRVSDGSMGRLLSAIEAKLKEKNT